MAVQEHGSAHQNFSTGAKLLLVLAIIGAINWGLIGFFNFNLVAAILGEGSTASRIVYALVGLAGLGAAFLTPWSTRVGEDTHLRQRSTA